MIVSMPLTQLLAEYTDGDERGWDAEFAFLRTEHHERIAALTASIAHDGIKEPIMLGNDGRVWDGHHRLCVAHSLGLPNVPVDPVEATK